MLLCNWMAYYILKSSLNIRMPVSLWRISQMKPWIVNWPGKKIYPWTGCAIHTQR